MRDFALEVHFSRWEFKARFNLTASDAQSLSVADLLALASPRERDEFHKLQLGYTETFGAPVLRQEIAATYDSIDSDHVLCLAGAGEGIYVAMQVLLQPQDHMIVITPNYQSAETVPLGKCEVSGVALNANANWSLDLERIRQALQPNTKLISINFPNNPTGAIPALQTITDLVSLCRQRGIWLFSDEVYRLIERDSALRIPQVADIYEKGLSLNVLSKAYGLPGLRIGWLACQDRDARVRVERFKHFLSSCNSAPSEMLAIIALRARDTILARNRKLVLENTAVAADFFSRHPGLFEFTPPDGGCVCFTRYHGADGVEEFTRRLVDEAGVLLLPASIYRSDVGEVPQDYFRLGLGRAFVPQAFAAMDRWLAARK